MTERTVEIVITPNERDYRQLVENLQVLRAAGCESNTKAIVDAVREKADSVRPKRHLRRAA